MSPFPTGDGVRICSQHQQKLQLLMHDWQIVADLAFADLVLWYPNENAQLHSIGQARPFTAQTTLQEDVLGHRPKTSFATVVNTAWHQSVENVPAPVVAQNRGLHAWPLVHNSTIIAVLSVHRNLASQRRESQLEEVYRRSAIQLLEMISVGHWPDESVYHSGGSHRSPRVGDGLIRVDAHGLVEFASPNAISALRKLGIRETIESRLLTTLTMDHLDPYTPVDENLPVVLLGKSSAQADIKARHAVLTARSIPLKNQNSEHIGALVLLRDITEIRQRDEQLVGKDTTIREIHHRVKNNLQTVGSLLRIQARRTSSEEAQTALNQAMSKVQMIAMVHETLSQTLDPNVDLNQLMFNQFKMAVDIAGQNRDITPVIDADFGVLPADLATPLALVLNELASNAVEHGTGAEGGEVRMWARQINRKGQQILLVRISDDGPGSTTLSSTTSQQRGMGTKIVRNLVEYDLHGTIQWSDSEGEGSGTTVSIHIPLDQPK